MRIKHKILFTGCKRAKNRQQKKFAGIAYVFLAIILVVCCLAFAGCKVSAPAVVGGTHEQTRDSIRTEYIHDSTYIDRWHTRYVKGDTVFIHDSIDRWHDRFVYIHDSIDNSRIDSIPVIVEVEKKGNVFLQRSGIALWIIIALLVVSVIVGIVIKVAK